MYLEVGWNVQEMYLVTLAAGRLLRQHEPYPAIVMNRYWKVLMPNEAAPRFFGSFIDLQSRPVPPNLLHLMFDPDGMRPHLADW